MARRVVTGVFRGGRCQLNALGNAHETWSPAPVNEVITDILGKAVRIALYFTPRWAMYRLGDLSWLPGGSRVTFAWDDD